MNNTLIASKAVKLLPRINEFLYSIENKRTSDTFRYTLGTWAIFLSGIKSISASDVDTWSDDMIARFHTWLIKREYRVSTVACMIGTLKRYLIWLDSESILPETFRLERALNKWIIERGGTRYSAQARVRFPDSDVPRIVTYYDQLPLPNNNLENRMNRLKLLRARAIVHTLYSSAGRVSEVASLTREMVRDGKARECLVTGKGNKEYYLIFTADAQKAISDYCHERDYWGDSYPGLFISHGRIIGERLSRGTLWTIVVSAAKILEIKGSASPHAFRHYRAQQLLDGGMTLETLQSYLGHTNISITRRVYASKTSLSKIREQLDRFGIDAETAANSIPTG